MGNMSLVVIMFYFSFAFKIVVLRSVAMKWGFCGLRAKLSLEILGGMIIGAVRFNLERNCLPWLFGLQDSHRAAHPPTRVGHMGS